MNADSMNTKLSAKIDLGDTALGVASPDFGYLFGCQFGSAPTPEILSVGDGLQMVRVHATSIPAQVVEIQSIRDRISSELPFIKNPMGGFVAMVLGVYSAVPLDQRSLPIPTSGLFVHNIFEGRGAAMVANHVADKLASNITTFRALGKGRRAAAAAQAEATWIERNSVTIGLHSGRLLNRLIGVSRPWRLQPSRGIYVA